jgi:hypothetical protein
VIVPLTADGGSAETVDVDLKGRRRKRRGRFARGLDTEPGGIATVPAVVLPRGPALLRPPAGIWGRPWR